MQNFPEPTSSGRVVVCAVDLGPQTSHVIYHAAGFARALRARLRLVHVAERAHSIRASGELSRAYLGAVPYDAGDDEPDFAVRTGAVVERILQEVHRPGVEMLVTGTRGLGPVARFLLGSTSEGLLRGARVPVLLVPPNDRDIVFLASAAGTIMCGPVLAAIDPAERNIRQLQIASELATLAGEPLLLVTVASSATDDHAASAYLRERSRALRSTRPTARIVRHGNVAEEIAGCARAAHAGLVVMGLRDPARGRPGAMAESVLRAGRAFVLAVPESVTETTEQPAGGQPARLSAVGS